MTHMPYQTILHELQFFVTFACANILQRLYYKTIKGFSCVRLHYPALPGVVQPPKMAKKEPDFGFPLVISDK